MRFTYIYRITSRSNPVVLEKNTQQKYVSLAQDHFVYGDGVLKIATCDLRTLKTKTIAYQSSYATYIPESDERCILAGAPNTYQPIRYHNIDFREIYRQNSQKEFFGKSTKGFLYSASNKLYVYNTWGETTVWDLKKVLLLNEINPYYKKSKVVSAALSSDERYMAFTFQRGSFILISDMQMKEFCNVNIGYDVHKDSKIKFAVLQQKTYLILAAGNKISVYDFEKLRQKKIQAVCMQKYKEPITSFTLASEKRLISTDSRGRLIIWNLTDIERSGLDRFLCELRGESSQIINDCAYSKKYNKLITVGSQVLIWDFN